MARSVEEIEAELNEVRRSLAEVTNELSGVGLRYFSLKSRSDAESIRLSELHAELDQAKKEAGE